MVDLHAIRIETSGLWNYLLAIDESTRKGGAGLEDDRSL
jgi:hypothetical protein